MARKPEKAGGWLSTDDAGASGRPRRLARLNEGRWDPSLPARTEIHQGVFGRGLARAPGMRFVLVHRDNEGNEYEDPEPATVGRTDDPDAKLTAHPLFHGDNIAIERYCHEVLTRYGLPRLAAPGFFWEDAAGRLCWGPDEPAGILERLPLTCLFEPISSKFVDENIDDHPDCWEAPYASDFLDLMAQLPNEQDRYNAQFREAVRDSSTSPLMGVRRSHREPLDFPDRVFDGGLYFGERIGALKAEWRLGLLHGASLLNDQKRRAGASASARAASVEKASRAEAWKVQAVALARELYSTESNVSQVVRGVKRAAVKQAKTLQTGEDSSALQTIAGLKEGTVYDLLRDRRGEWFVTIPEVSSDDR